MEPIQSRFADSDVRIADLVSPEHPVLTEFTFTRCHVLGPAVLVPMGCSFVSCEWDAPGADWSALFWELDSERRTVVGAIALHNCTFDGCRLSGIGIAGAAALRERFLEDVGERGEPL